MKIGLMLMRQTFKFLMIVIKKYTINLVDGVLKNIQRF